MAYIIRPREVLDTSITMRNVKGNSRPRIKVMYEVGKMVDGVFRVSFGPTAQDRAKTWMKGRDA